MFTFIMGIRYTGRRRQEFFIVLKSITTFGRESTAKEVYIALNTFIKQFSLGNDMDATYFDLKLLEELRPP
jgi:hypothetical protein